MKTLLAFLVLAFMFSITALAAKPAKPPIECEAKTYPDNKRIDVICKSKHALKPGDALTIEININSHPGYPPEAV